MRGVIAAVVAAVCDRRGWRVSAGARGRGVSDGHRPTLQMGGYSLVEVLVAASILVIAAAGAAAMALAVSAQQDANARMARVLALQEQGARMYQLGMDPANINAILPPDPAVVSLTFTPVTWVGTPVMEQVTCTLVYKPFAATATWSESSWTGGDPSAQRSNEMTVVRPTIR